jgi:serine/threonine protein kinase
LEIKINRGSNVCFITPAKNPEKRPTAREALLQPFIEKHHRRNNPLKIHPELRRKIHDSIKQFISYSLFKKIIFQMIASRYPAKEILDLTQIFTEIDTTGEGTVSFSDFKVLFLENQYSDAELRSMFDLIVSVKKHRFRHFDYTHDSL